MALDLNPFIEKRTKALATVALTRRRDLELIWLNEDEAGLDLLVKVARDDVPGQHHFIKSFGVILKGTANSPTRAAEATDQLNELMPYQERKRFSMPVIVLFFSMEQDRGYYSWYCEPRVEADGPKLSFPDRLECHVMDDRRLEKVVDAVDRWYLSLYKVLMTA